MKTSIHLRAYYEFPTTVKTLIDCPVEMPPRAKSFCPYSRLSFLRAITMRRKSENRCCFTLHALSTISEKIEVILKAQN